MSSDSILESFFTTIAIIIGFIVGGYVGYFVACAGVKWLMGMSP